MDDKFNDVFAKRLLYYMYYLNISQKELSDRVGVSESSVSQWVKGTKVPRADKVDKICDVFNCKRSDLVDNPTAKTPVISDSDLEFLGVVSELDADSQALVYELATLLRKDKPDSDDALAMIGKLSKALNNRS